MTREELENYVELDKKFGQDCNRVAAILRKRVREASYGGCNIAFADEFYLSWDDVKWVGEETWSYGGYERHSGSFPKEYLTMSDEELQAIVDKENKEWEEEIDRKKREKEEREKAKRMEEYEKLKKEFGG